MNIVFLVFGDKLVYHLQTYFAIVTVLKNKRGDDTVTIYTDHPEHYKRLESVITIEAFDEITLSDWMDGKGYIYRAKIKAIEESARKNPDRHLLFLDGDTCVTGGLDGIRAALDRGEGVMHTDEGHPSKMKGRSLGMWNAVKGTDMGAFRISMRHNVWNSGVIGIPKTQLDKVIPLALEACDMILAKDGKCFTSEQYAFSIAMQESCRIVPAKAWIAHYWGNKEEWLAAIGDIVVATHMAGLTVEEEIRNLDLGALCSVPLLVRRSNTQRRLTKLICKIFPDRIKKS